MPDGAATVGACSFSATTPAEVDGAAPPSGGGSGAAAAAGAGAVPVAETLVPSAISAPKYEADDFGGGLGVLRPYSLKELRLSVASALLVSSGKTCGGGGFGWTIA